MKIAYICSMRKLYILLLAIAAWACSDDAPAPAAISNLMECEGTEAEYKALFSVMGHESTPQAYAASAVVQAFKPAIDRVFPTLEPLEAELGRIISNTEADSLSIPHLSFAAAAWGYSQSIVRVDSVVLIALNHYLGADFDGYSHLQAYQRLAKTPEMLPYNLAEAIVATQYPFEKQGQSVLSRMLYEGAIVEAVMRMVPKARLHMALGCTADELDWMEAHERDIWNDMAIRRLVYDSSPVSIDRLFQPAPSSPMLDGQTPGRAARFIGYKIVKSYQSHHRIPLAYLLSPTFYASESSLIEAGY